jgi:hypothetical protein
MRFRGLVAAATLVSLPLLAHADSFTYYVAQNFDAFSVSGTITTDIDSGVVRTADITRYDLVVSDGLNTLDLTTKDSHEAVFDSLRTLVTATPAGLFFDFGNSHRDTFLFQSPDIGAGINYLCFQGLQGGCDDNAGPHESTRIGGDGQRVQVFSGKVEFASTSPPPVTTPEPEDFILVGTGLFGLVGVARLKLHAK